MSYIQKSIESTKSVILNNKLMMLAMFIGLGLSYSNIPVLSFVIGMGISISLYGMISFIEKEKTDKKLNFFKYIKTPIGLYVGNLIVMITSFIVFFIVEAFLFYFSGYFDNLNELKFLKPGEDFWEIYRIILSPRLILPLFGILVYGIFMYVYSYFISLAMRVDDDINNSLETVMKVFNYQINKKIFYDYDYFIYVLKYIGVMLIIMFSVFLPAFLLVAIFGLSFDNSTAFKDYSVIFFLIAFIYVIYFFMVMFFYTIFTYFYTYNIKNVIEENIDFTEEEMKYLNIYDEYITKKKESNKNIKDEYNENGSLKF